MNLFLPIQPPSISPSKDTRNSYKEYLPNHVLRPHIVCYWDMVYNASDIQETHRVLPDGCVDLKYGYYDQAHFIKEFKQFYGLVPSMVFPSRK
jgi:hypothetical protein